MYFRYNSNEEYDSSSKNFLTQLNVNQSLSSQGVSIGDIIICNQLTEIKVTTDKDEQHKLFVNWKFDTIEDIKKQFS